MKHFAIYHSITLRGPVREAAKDEPFAILTNRPVGNAIGSRIWLISGHGSPTSYRVHFAFTAEGSESGADEGFKHRVWGTEGLRFTPPVRIDAEPWFAALAKSQGNFAFGLKEITVPDAIAGLLRIAATAPSVAAEVPNEEVQIGDPTFPDEVAPSASYREGAVQRVLVSCKVSVPL